MRMQNPLAWFEIYVEDMHRAKFFYERVFGFHLKKMNTRSWDVDRLSISLSEEGGSFGSLIWDRDVQPSGISSVVYFASSSDDCAVEEKRAVEAGGKVYKTKYSIGQYGYMSLVKDTEGNLIGIHSRK